MIEGDDIGTGAGGSMPQGNGSYDVLISAGATGNTVGGTSTIGLATLGARNLIDASPAGVEIRGVGTANNMVEGNYIGLAADGSTSLANNINVLIDGGASNNTIGGLTTFGGAMTPGGGNVIAAALVVGVDIQAGSGDVVEGNIIGLAADGSTSRSNFTGVLLELGTANDTVGGTSAGAGNVISGNNQDVTLNVSSGALVAGNFIGLGADLKSPSASGIGVFVNGSTGLTIGGTTAGARNVISGNINGVEIYGTSGVLVEGNTIGLTPDGSTAVLNATGVLILQGASNDTIGGTSAGAGNVISGNTKAGIEIDTATNILIEGNTIGVVAAGTISYANAVGILLGAGTTSVTSGDTIGGMTAGSGNVIGVNLTGIDLAFTSNDLIAGNSIGLPVAGNAFEGNRTGILIGNTSGGITIGGTSALSRNIVSNNLDLGVDIEGGTGDSIAGNVIGLKADGLTKAGNPTGVRIAGSATDVTIGGNVAGAGNVISGNSTAGIDIEASSGDLVAGNFIGVGSDGATLAANGTGVSIAASSGITVGGTTIPARNVISANSAAGVDIEGGARDLVEGNFIGLPSTGFIPTSPGLPPSPVNLVGIKLGSATILDTIGGSTLRAGNLVSGNDTGILIAGVGTVNNAIQGNFVGLATDGFTPAGNNFGIAVLGGASLLTIGGTSAGARNVLSGNGDGVDLTGVSKVLIEGDDFGTASNGMADPSLPKGSAAVRIFAGTSAVTIGGTAAVARNILSDAGFGVDDEGGTGDTIAGNFIGLAADGLTPVGNNFGVTISAATKGDTVGGTAAGAGNVISGNINAGIFQGGDSSNVVIGNVIGLAADGSTVEGNGIGFLLGAGMSNVTIGGAGLGAGNVISGNATGLALSGGTNIDVIGLLIGVTVDGEAARGNGVGISIIDVANVTIGGTTAGARDVIEGNADGAGLSIQGGSGIVVEGDYIGVAADGSTPLGGGIGVLVASASNVTIGGTTAAARNVISGNAGDGVLLTGSGTSGVAVEGNLIGLALDGLSSVGNGVGVVIGPGATGDVLGGTLAGSSNVIAGNALGGVVITGAGASGNLVEGNVIGLAGDGLTKVGNGTGSGIQIDPGPSRNTIGGTTPAARNVISGNAAAGVDLSGFGTMNNVVEGNDIGLAADGVTPKGNGVGVFIAAGASGNLIGGVLGAGNVISGNLGVGVYLTGTGTSGNSVEGNVIGLDSSTSVAIGNGADGVRVDAGATSDAIGGTIVGATNVIGDNGGAGVLVVGAGSTGILIVGNVMFQNAGTGIVLDGGANPGVATPLLKDEATTGSTTQVVGSVVGAPGASFLISLYGNIALDSNSTVEGRDFLGFQLVQAGPNGTANFQFTIAAGHGLFTATASNASGSTSTFSQLRQTDLTVVQSTSPTALQAGSSFSFQLAVGNKGPYPASNVVVTDVLPSAFPMGPDGVDVTGVSGATYSFSGGVLTVNLPSLPVGQSAKISIRFNAAPANALLKNVVSVDLASGVVNLNPTDNVASLQAFVAPTPTPGASVRPTYVIGPATSVSSTLMMVDFQIDGIAQSPLMVGSGEPITINGSGNDDLFVVDLNTPSNAMGLPMTSPLTLIPGGDGGQFVFQSIPNVPGLDVLVAGLTGADGLFFPNPIGSDKEVFESVNPALGQTQLSTGSSGSSPPTSIDVPLAFQGSPVVGPITALGGVGLVGSAGVGQIGITGTGFGQFMSTFSAGLPSLDFVSSTVTATGRGDTHSFRVAPVTTGGAGLSVDIVGQGTTSDQLVLADGARSENGINLQDGPLSPGSLNYTGIDSILLASKPKGNAADTLTFSESNPSADVHVVVTQSSSQLTNVTPGASQPLTILGDAVGNNLEVDSMAAGQTVLVSLQSLPPKTLHGLSVIGLPASPGILDVRFNRSAEQVQFEPYPQYDSGVFIVTTHTGRVYTVAYTNMVPYLNGVAEKVTVPKKATKPVKKPAVKVQHASAKQTPAGPKVSKKSRTPAGPAAR